MTGGLFTSGALLLLASAAVGAPPAALAFSNVAVGEDVPNADFPALAGGKHALLSGQARANVFIFFRPRQDHSLEALTEMATCEREFSAKPVHFVAVVSSKWSSEEVRTIVAQAGIRMPVLIDEGDALYGRLGVRLHPVVGIANERFQLVSYEPFRQIQLCDRVRARIRYALGEIGRAEVEQVDAPARSLFPNEMKGAIAGRHLRMGESFLKTKQYDRAATEARHVLVSDPLHAPAHLLLGEALAGQGKCDEARGEYDSARRLDPNLAPAVRGRNGCASP